MSALSNEDLARLSTHLVVPVAVYDILSRRTDVPLEVQYGIHESLSESDPDTALLAIALAARHIALHFYRDIPVAAGLGLEAQNILDDYGPDWLAHAEGGTLTRHQAYDILRFVPEDLEALADLLEALKGELTPPASPAAMLCDVLAIQARAHMEIAEYILTEGEDGNIPEPAPVQAPSAAGPVGGDNIVLFPIHLRQ